MSFIKEETDLQKIKLGLIPSPDLPAKLTNNFVSELPNFLSTHVDDSVSWEPVIIVDPLVGSAEYMNQLMNQALNLKSKNEWNYAICLTDLPYFKEKRVAVADVDTQNQVALVSIPSLGPFPIKHRTMLVISKILKDIHHKHEKSEKTSIYRRDKNNKDEQTQEDTEKDSDIQYIIKTKLLGYLCLLAGMTFANRPWTALISFKKVLMLAFGTGIYITLFPTPWELSTIYTIPRFIVLMFFAIFSMVIWIIFAHKLWEKPTQKGDAGLRKLYNYTTVTTLAVIIFINYIVLFCLLLGVIGIFVPPGLFEVATDLDEEPTIKYYFLLTWLITSLGTLAGSIGTVSENEDKIRNTTYYYRQITRYYQIQDEKKDDEV